MKQVVFHRAPVALACAFAVSSLSLAVHAQGVATDASLPQVTVTDTSERSGLGTSQPSSTAGKSAADLRTQNLFNPEDALQYLPNTTVRKRYLGDRNALIAGRSFGTLQPSRALVYLDGYLISNFLGRFDAPRWNMISPEAIERVDALYGPYSALFPGNSIGTTVAVTQRPPEAFEISGRLVGAWQRFSQYGQKDEYGSSQASLRIGNKLASGLWYSADLNHQDATSQPMQYYAQLANAAGTFPTVSGPATQVTGITYDTDPKGLRRAVFGANGGAIDHTTQDTLNLRAGYRFTPDLEANVMGAWWVNDSDARNESFLRDAAGNPVWKDKVTDGTNTFNIPDVIFSPSGAITAAAFAPWIRNEYHQQLGATLKTRNAKGWNASLVVSDYRILSDIERRANEPDPTAAQGGSGTITKRDGTGWRTAEVQGTWTPSPGDWTDGHHALAFGLHRNSYRLDNTVESVGDWRADTREPTQYYRGKTTITALYAQDAWRFAPDWKLTLGWREEWFKAFDGSQFNTIAFTNPPTTLFTPYESRSLRGHSPKASLSYFATDALLLKVSVGRGVRFPNVEELYNGTVTSGSLTKSDPNLKAETSDAIELSAEQEWETQRLRISLFQDDVKDAILRQTTQGVSTCGTGSGNAGSYTCVQNVDRVKTSGIEMAWSAQDFGLKGLGVEASAAYTFRSEVTANSGDPSMVGKWWLRVPKTRATLQLSWRANAQWLLAAGYRHEGRAYNDTLNADINPDVYGGVSRVDQLDLRGAYKLSKQLELALGINNATDQRAYQSHPYPGRTLFAELRFSN